MIIDLTAKIKLIRPEPRAAFPYSNSLYIDDDIKVVIDAGAGGRAFAGLPAQEVEMLFLSHYHFDHTHGTSLFDQAGIMAGVEEAPAYNDPVAYLSYSGLERWEMLMGEVKSQSFAGGSNLPPDVYEKPGFRNIPLAGTFQNGDRFSLGETCFQTIHIPGHTHGHYAFWFEKQGIIFAADIDLSPGGPWYGEALSDFDAVIKSVEKIMEIDPPILVSSHRRVFRQKENNIKQLLREYLEVAFKREEDILTCLSQPRTIDDIASLGLVYDRQPRTAHLVFWNKMMILKHLERLERMGMVKKADESRYVRTDHSW